MKREEIEALIEEKVAQTLKVLLLAGMGNPIDEWVGEMAAAKKTGIPPGTIRRKRQNGTYRLGVHYRLANTGEVGTEQGKRYVYNWRKLGEV